MAGEPPGPGAFGWHRVRCLGDDRATVGGRCAFVKEGLGWELRRLRMVGRPASVPTIRKWRSDCLTRRHGLGGHLIRPTGGRPVAWAGAVLSCRAGGTTWWRAELRQAERSGIRGLGGESPPSRPAESALAGGMPRAVTKRSGLSVAWPLLLLRRPRGFGGIHPQGRRRILLLTLRDCGRETTIRSLLSRCVRSKYRMSEPVRRS